MFNKILVNASLKTCKTFCMNKKKNLNNQVFPNSSIHNKQAINFYRIKHATREVG